MQESRASLFLRKKRTQWDLLTHSIPRWSGSCRGSDSSRMCFPVKVLKYECPCQLLPGFWSSAFKFIGQIVGMRHRTERAQPPAVFKAVLSNNWLSSEASWTSTSWQKYWTSVIRSICSEGSWLWKS